MEEYAVQVDDIEEQRYEGCPKPKVYDIDGDPMIHPLVGKEYQAELPPLMSESDYNCFQKKQQEFQVGLPIPIIWIKDDEALLVNRKKVEQETNIGVVEKKKCKGLVPECSNDTNWNEIEEASLTLGLHIFGKNLVHVERFIGNKTMKDILTFYYTKFYKSDNHQRWCRYRKMNTNIDDRIYRPKIFTGKSQGEFLSRLLLNVPDELRSKLLKVSKRFEQEEISLESYVFTLKGLAGLNALIEAVGIGKENDLTSLTANTVKFTYAVPVGKDCSKLTSAEIIHYLTGDFRLSKSRASDLFWEAVWPRLLARGWNSEQSGSNNNYTLSSKNPLLFIVPGVEKFSRKLVKGTHYFDSISDVLAKVASNPMLIEDEEVVDNNTKEAKLDCEVPQKRKVDSANSQEVQRKKRGTSIDTLSVPAASSGTKDQCEKPHQRIIIDLNLPFLPELEDEEPMENEVGEEQQNNEGIELDGPNVDTVSIHENHSENQPGPQRKSLRAPQYTIRALEAIVDKCDEEKKNKLKHADSALLK